MITPIRKDNQNSYIKAVCSMDNKTLSSPIFKITGIVDAAMFLIFIVCRAIAEEPYGKVINDAFLGQLCTYKVLHNLSEAAFFCSLFLLGAIIVLVIRGFHPVYLVFVGLSIVMFFIPFSRAITPIMHKPEVVTVTCVNKYSYVSGSYSRSQHYCLVFDNGSSIGVKKEEYTDAVGKTFYIVMCGNTAIESLDPAEYRIGN